MIGDVNGDILLWIGDEEDGCDGVLRRNHDGENVCDFEGEIEIDCLGEENDGNDVVDDIDVVDDNFNNDGECVWLIIVWPVDLNVDDVRWISFDVFMINK